jgi:hypothetical protein
MISDEARQAYEKRQAFKRFVFAKITAYDDSGFIPNHINGLSDDIVEKAVAIFTLPCTPVAPETESDAE